jgi:hypothetical protein
VVEVTAAECAVRGGLALLVVLSLLLIGYAVGRSQSKGREQRDRRLIEVLRLTVSKMTPELRAHAPAAVMERIQHEIDVAWQDARPRFPESDTHRS